MKTELFIFASFILSNVCAYKIGYRIGWNDSLTSRVNAQIRLARSRYMRNE